MSWTRSSAKRRKGLARLLITGAIAALFVGVAPLVLKTVGSTTVPTVGGLVAAAFCTLVGVAGQILATTWIFKTEDPSDGPGVVPDYLWEDLDLVSGLAIILIAFLLFYGFWTIKTLLVEAFPKPAAMTAPPVPHELVYAAALAASTDGDKSQVLARLTAAKAAAAEFEADAAEAEGAGGAGPMPSGQRPLWADLSQLGVSGSQQQPQLFSGIL